MAALAAELQAEAIQEELSAVEMADLTAEPEDLTIVTDLDLAELEAEQSAALQEEPLQAEVAADQLERMALQQQM